MSEMQFGQKRKSMEKEIRGSQLVPKSEFLDCRTKVTDDIVSNFEYFKHGNTKESIQVSNCKENLKGEILVIRAWNFPYVSRLSIKDNTQSYQNL